MSCIFCRIIKGDIPSHKLFETELSYAFLDINPLSAGHALVIPKFHAQFFHQVPDDTLADMLPVAKKVALALGPAANYNILQNNGSMAHQAVDHVHFHIIPKTETDGLGIQWRQQPTDHGKFAELASQIREKIAAQQ